MRLWDASSGRPLGPRCRTRAGRHGSRADPGSQPHHLRSSDSTVRLWDRKRPSDHGPRALQRVRWAGAVLNRDERRLLSWAKMKSGVGHCDRLARRRSGRSAQSSEGGSPVFTADQRRVLTWTDNVTGAVGHREWPADRPTDETRDRVRRRRASARTGQRILSWSGNSLRVVGCGQRQAGAPIGKRAT